MADKPLNVTRIKIRNFMQIDLAEIDLNGTITVIGGENESGKTSVIKAIASILGGKACMPPKPLRDGKSVGEIVAELSNGLHLIRKFNSSGTQFTIVDGDGVPVPSPQALVNGLKGDFTIDPLAFMNLKGDKKTEMVKKLAGLDFTDMKTEHDEIFAKRRAINNQTDMLSSQLVGIPFDKSAPKKVVSISDLTTELECRHQSNRENDSQRSKISDIGMSISQEWQDMESSELEISHIENNLKEAKSRLAASTKMHAIFEKDLIMQEEVVSKLKDENTDEIQEQISTAEETNAIIRSNTHHAEVSKQLDTKTNEADKLTGKIDALKDKKKSILEKANLPVKGLSFDGEVLMYKNIPFEQCSGEVQLRISTAMGFAENTKLKTILIDEGSRISKGRLKLLAEMAEEQGGQIIITRVDTDRTTDYVMTHNTAVAFIECPDCKGKGCDKCGMIGKVEDAIQEELL